MTKEKRRDHRNDDLVAAGENCLPHILMFYKRIDLIDLETCANPVCHTGSEGLSQRRIRRQCCQVMGRRELGLLGYPSGILSRSRDLPTYRRPLPLAEVRANIPAVNLHKRQ
jgi:hypothetical protein